MGLREDFARDIGGYSSWDSYFIWDGDEKSEVECYGEIEDKGNDYSDGNYANELIVFHPSKRHFDRDLYDFIMQPEVFGEVFVYTDLDKGMKCGWEVDTSLPYQKVLAGMIALRFCFNAGSSNNTYSVFKRHGASTLEAFILTHFFRETHGTIRLIGGFGDHTVFSPRVDISSVLKTPKTLEVLGRPTSESTILEGRTWNMFPTRAAGHRAAAAKVNAVMDKKQYIEKEKVWGGYEISIPPSAENVKDIIKSMREGMFG